MAYNVNQKATVGQLKALALRAKGAVTDAIAALPVEMFLDTVNTKFVPTFAFSDTTYPGASNPNLEGKPVMVLVMKGVDNADPTNTAKQTTNYSFLDMSKLVDTYTVKAGDSAKVLGISGYEVEFKRDSSTKNKLTITDNGLMVDISSSGTTEGHIAKFDADGYAVDGGIVASTILTTNDVATDAEVTEMLNEVFGTPAA